MLAAAPAWAMLRNELLDHLFERWGDLVGQSRLDALSLPFSDGIEAVRNLLLEAARSFASLLQRVDAYGTEAHLPAAATVEMLVLVFEHPTPRTVLPNSEIEALAVGVQAGLFCSRHEQSREWF